MSEETWKAVEQYFVNLVVRPDAVLQAAAAAGEAAGLPPIAVTPNHGKLLMLLGQAIGAKRILEIGTLAGYSTIWLGRALQPGGRLITLEADAKHADVARKNFVRAGVSEVIELRLGKALETLPQLSAEQRGPFDLIFIDADKENNAEYFRWALKLSRVGSLIIVDNVVREGHVIEAATRDKSVQGVRRCNEAMAAEPRVSVTALQTVGSKGYDGFSVALVTS
ncbi:MAG TPA: O-methyltransferase [Pirellulales bacterium]|nr:O-methyltransferase [Pirellulales bacterium]